MSTEAEAEGVRSQAELPNGKNLTSFSPQTCYELVTKLTDKQLMREKDFVLDPAIVAAYTSTRNDGHIITQTREALKKHFKELSDLASDFYLKDVSTLNTYFTRHTENATKRMMSASLQMEQLQKEIAGAHTLISQLMEPLTLSELQEELTALDVDGTDSIAATGTEVCPFERVNGTPFESFNADTLDSACHYDRTYRNRQVAYYGDVAYRYSGGYHPARDISQNTYLSEIAKEVKKHMPELEYNSVMVTKYDSPDSYIPPHSDDEECIALDSHIVTVSLGNKREVVFRKKPSCSGTYRKEVLVTEHGSVYSMSRASQDYWDHSVPKVKQEDFMGMRLSITFRKLEWSKLRSRRSHPNGNSSSTGAPTDRSTSDSRPSPPRRVLILSDSKNSTFDCSLFREPVVAFRENMFYLRDLENHSRAIEQVDLVLISAGVNDLKHGRVDPITLHNHLVDVTSQYKTEFLFDSISPLNMSADRFNTLNDSIDSLNELMLQYSLRSKNFKLFDNTNFGLSHLARDGLHLNNSGKDVLSACWVNCVLKQLGFRKGNLPLRYSFLKIVSTYHGSG